MAMAEKACTLFTGAEQGGFENLKEETVVRRLRLRLPTAW